MSNVYNDDTPDFPSAADFEEIEPGAGRVGVEVHAPTPDLPVPPPGGTAVTLESVKTAYSEMFGCSMTKEQIANVFQIAEKMGVRGDDGIWLLLLALENYQRLYIAAPWAITAATKQAIQEVRDEASAAALDAAQEVKKDLARIAKKAAGVAGWRRHMPYIWTLAAGGIGFILGQLTPPFFVSVWIYQNFFVK